MKLETLPITLALTLAAGCASYEAAPLTEKAARDTQGCYDRGGVCLVGEALVHESTKRLYFGSSFPHEDYVPVVLRLSNTSMEPMVFDLQLANLQLRSSRGTSFERVSTREVLGDAEYSAWRSLPWWPLAIWPGYEVLSSVQEANDAMAADWVAKSLDDIRLGHGRPCQKGVVFFRAVDEDVDLDEVEDLGELALSLSLYRNVEDGEQGDVVLDHFNLVHL